MNCAVLCYPANCVTYFRLFLLLFSITHEGMHYLVVQACIGILDMFDGYVARKYNQSSILGACLDMTVDRMATVVICTKILQHRDVKGLLLCLILDLVSHYFYFIGSLMTNRSHKDPKSSILKFYYKKWVLTTLVVMNETFYMCMYGCKISFIFKYGVYLSVLFFHIKNIINIFQFVEALELLSNIKMKNE